MDISNLQRPGENELLGYVRDSFLKFFADQDHLVLKSAPLIPQNDASLLFINAGMAPLKEYFLAQSIPPATNLASCQKCIRAGGKHNDLDQVGYTKRHHTFFEMCGNFSFGGYTQEKAIQLAWEFLSQLKIDQSRLWITVHPEDKVSKEIWLKLVPADKIVELEENEWSMGGDGPCGRCTEIFFDHGAEIPGTIEDGDRFVELWNIVFMTHEVRQGVKTELPKICIDTGMGLERIVAVICGTDDNYKAPLFGNIIQEMMKLTGKPLSADFKIIADHARAAVFAISDGIMPDVSSRGYVIRKIIRRALVHAYSYRESHPEGLLKLAANYMIEVMGEAYPELQTYKTLINTTLDDEKRSMDEILDNAWELIEKLTNKIKDKDKVPGETLFFLHDTHGIPIEVTCSILEKMNLVADLDGYHEVESRVKQQPKTALPTFSSSSNFVGYDQLEAESVLLEQTVWEDSMILVFDSTPFYPESGGQESDQGQIISPEFELEVRYVKKSGNTILHFCDQSDQVLEIGKKYRLVVDKKRRTGLAKHHSATHLLLSVLRNNLGLEVMQKGSLVRENSLRFDFLYDKPIEPELLSKIEFEVNQLILSGHSSKVESLGKAEAMKAGAVATFGEKYGEVVRVVSIGSSVELCGGTHVKNSGDIGSFYILKSVGVAGGVRRIEAVAGEAAYQYARNQIDLIARLAAGLRVQESVLEQTVLRREKGKAEVENAVQKLKINTHKVTFCYSKNNTQGNMLKLTDQHIKDNDIVLVANVANGKTSFILKTKNLDANQLLKQMLQMFGGNGGGKNTLAQGGVDRILSKEEVEGCIMVQKI